MTNEEVKDVVAEIEPEDVEVTDLSPIVKESSGMKTLLGGAAIATGVGFLGAKISQKVYHSHCDKKGIETPSRERWFQFWRKKAKKSQPRMIPANQVKEDQESDSDDE